MFGRVNANPLPPGLHLTNPFLTVTQVNVQSQTINYLNLPTLTSEGLTVEVDVAVTFRVNATKAVGLYSTVGRNWQEVLLHPQVRATIRGIVSGFTSKELYDTERRSSVASLLYEKIKEDLEPRGIIIEAVPLRAIHLPTRVRESIENKLRMEQENERMQFVLQKERAEAERKAIEGKGIAEFQRIVSEGINENLLKWKGIETTETIAQSQNTKVIIIGAGHGDGLPVIFSAAEGTAAAA
jgi:regulator of protease activity HflC (stomatin/prohibitin superfamily)